MCQSMFMHLVALWLATGRVASTARAPAAAWCMSQGVVRVDLSCTLPGAARPASPRSPGWSPGDPGREAPDESAVEKGLPGAGSGAVVAQSLIGDSKIHEEI